MEERDGRILLNGEETRQMRNAALHPDGEALHRRDAFLARFADAAATYEDDGSMSFERSGWTETQIERVEMFMANQEDTFCFIFSTVPVVSQDDYWDAAA